MKVSPDQKAILVTIDAENNSKEHIFNIYAQSLKFPKYFADNWDSFEECLSDLSWIEHDMVLLYHKNWFDNPMHKDNIYTDIIENVANEESSKIIILYD